jgi:hypothetical protein
MVSNMACGDRNGESDFFIADHHHSSSLHSSWAGNGTPGRARRIKVPVITLDSYFAQSTDGWPDLIKMDIEGGGTFALAGATRCFAEKRPYVIIESHTPQEDAAVSNVLTSYEYKAYRFDDKQWVQDRSATHPNPKGVWGTMFLCPEEKYVQLLAHM